MCVASLDWWCVQCHSSVVFVSAVGSSVCLQDLSVHALSLLKQPKRPRRTKKDYADGKVTTRGSLLSQTLTLQLLLFWEKRRKTHEKSKVSPTPKILGKEGKNAQKARKIGKRIKQGNRKKKQGLEGQGSDLLSRSTLVLVQTPSSLVLQASRLSSKGSQRSKYGGA